MKIISLCNYTEIGIYNLFINSKLPVSVFEESIIAIAFTWNDLHYVIKEINNIEPHATGKSHRIHFYLSTQLYDYYEFITFLITCNCYLKFLKIQSLYKKNIIHPQTNWINNQYKTHKVKFSKSEISYLNAIAALTAERINKKRLTLPYFYYNDIYIGRMRYNIINKLRMKRNRFILYKMSDIILDRIATDSA
ncbi:hypothetical protein GTGU_04331 [Trabulsiella guamensis ATCC 49490]|uniref:Uncharacterized protein n=1 Tax=Trabulsiella guamensis ATCC 49490 TaxID=1005994 RepID=A0A084ZPD4_9ENTR|nr:hypothetical protein GTGU_04331 [Trabulsiella guamensis ATCC 49490]